jgi:predicted O-linked N-acetylglucosamine transferase (SPINDLY family)
MEQRQPPAALRTLLHSVSDALRVHDPARALSFAEAARQVAPEDADVLAAYGIALKVNGRLQEALDALQASLARRPCHAPTLTNLARVHRACGALADAASAFRAAISADARCAETWSMLSNTERERGAYAEALACAQRALALKPELREAHLNEGAALYALGRYDDACASIFLAAETGEPTPQLAQVLARAAGLAHAPFRAAVLELTASPTPERWQSLVNALREQGRQGSALRCAELSDDRYQSADASLVAHAHALGLLERVVTRFAPRVAAGALSGALAAALGRVYLDLQKPARAEALLRLALGSADDSPVLHNLGLALQQQAKPSEAAECYRAALAKSPARSETWLNLGSALCECAEPSAALSAIARGLALDPHQPGAQSNYLFAMHLDEACSPDSIFEAHRQVGERLEQAVVPCPPRSVHSSAGRLRVGYVSSDFRDHPVASFLLPILRHHDRQKIEVFCYSDAAVGDATTARIAKIVDVFRTTSRLSDEALADLVRSDRIDILVDLAGHTGHHRLGVFARRPAPVQASWIGYFDTTGLTRIDYRIGDAASFPADADARFTERIFRLPRTANCYEPPEGAPDVATAPCQKLGYVTFGCFNNPSKLGAGVLGSFGNLLERVPASRLLLKYGSYADLRLRARFLAYFTGRGIDPERIAFEGHSPMADYLARFSRIDIALDPFPYSGETTALHALWMGVPVIAIEGETLVQRLASRVLRVAGLHELVAKDRADYVALGTALAADHAALAVLRASLRTRLRASPLLDHAGVTRELEAAYRAMLAGAGA